MYSFQNITHLFKKAAVMLFETGMKFEVLKVKEMSQKMNKKIDGFTHM